METFSFPLSRSKTARCLIVAIAGVGLAALTGCEDPKPAPDGWTTDGFGSDTAPDTTVDTEPSDVSDTGDADASPSPQSTTFRLTNAANRQVTLVGRNGCRPIGWSVLEHDGTLLDAETSCRVCSCDEARDGSCGVCELPCAQPSVETLQPGDTIEWTWGGVAYERKRVSRRTCHDRRIYPTGEQLAAHFCWYEARDPSGNPVGRECREVSFRYGRKEVVSREITNVRSLHPKTFELVNDSGSTIRYDKARGCTTPGWVRTPREGTSIATGCTCRCRQLRDQRGCPACACSPGNVQSLAPGESVSWDWPGHVYVDDDWQGTSCQRRDLPDPSSQLSLEFCWSEKDGPTGTGNRLDKPSCDTKSFRPTSRTTTIRKVVR